MPISRLAAGVQILLRLFVPRVQIGIGDLP